MKNQTIRFSKKPAYFQLGMGTLWMLLFLSLFLSDKPLKWNAWGFLGLGIVYLVMGIIQLKRSYLLFGDQEFFVAGIRPKKIQYSKIKVAKYAAGDYIISGDSDEIRIPKSHIQKEDQLLFEEAFNDMIERFSIKKQ